jgi:plasmid maintenance system antidote protein VapI
MVRGTKKELPKRLSDRLDDKNWTIRELARVALVPEQRLYDNFSGAAPMSLQTALSVISALGYSVETPAMLLLAEIQEHHERHKHNKSKIQER